LINNENDEMGSSYRNSIKQMGLQTVYSNIPSKMSSIEPDPIAELISKNFSLKYKGKNLLD
jgi:hypothetical protein